MSNILQYTAETAVPPEKYPSLSKKICSAFEKLRHKLILIKIKSANVQTIGDVYYTIKAIIKFDGEQMDCILKQVEQPYKNYYELEVNCPEKCYHAVIRRMRKKPLKHMSNKEGKSRSADEVGEIISEALMKLGQQQSIYYSLSRIDEMEHKVANGSKYCIKARLIKSNLKIVRCDLRLWEQPWRNFWDVTIRFSNGRIYNVVQGKEDSSDKHKFNF